ncbi:MAG: BMC domain-containing protein [Myxococcota bacterium]|jgi:microcompartment protein CcmL/EutN|nr:BMC domain-containing protein [Myxococcota bacterium]
MDPALRNIQLAFGRTLGEKPAIGMVEFNSIAGGIATADAMLKRAPVDLLECRPVCPGKFIVLVGGMTDPVNEAMAAADERGTEAVVDRLLLPNVHPSIFPAIVGAVEVQEVESLGIIETISVASTIVAADASAKAADVTLTEMRLANGLGGKSFYLMVGTLHDVEAATEAGLEMVRSAGLLVRYELIQQLHDGVRQKVMF